MPGKEGAAIYVFQRLPPIPSAFTVHTPRLELAAGDPELLNVLAPINAERHCWMIILVQSKLNLAA